MNSQALKVMLVDDSVERMEKLREQLSLAGYQVIAEAENTINLQRQIMAAGPDVVIIGTDSPSRDTLEDLCVVTRDTPKPIVMFTHDGDVEKIRASTRAGVSAYVVGGLAVEQFRPVMEAAVVRFEEHSTLKAELMQAKSQLEDRKMVERAKGIVMQQRGMAEDEAYQWMRKQAMARNQKMADLAQQLVDAAKLLL